MSGSVAAAIEGQAKRVVGDVTRQYLNGVRFFVCEHATRNPVLPRIIDAVAQESAVRIVEKAWSDSHLFGLLVMLLYLEVALALLVAFGASHDEDVGWAFKQFALSIPNRVSAMTT